MIEPLGPRRRWNLSATRGATLAWMIKWRRSALSCFPSRANLLDPSLNTPCRIQGPKLGSNELLSLGSGCAHPAQPQLRLEHEQLSFLNGKGNCLGAHLDIVLAVIQTTLGLAYS
ncbi:uncharacterized protein BDZ99DRAFT_176691 [Mytilinidion resinicola]|uniref:Uncharacterized protein n=1 Tax=Mytilinidion resinicola TaxID=574789 RepID=A0A6A6Y2X9_9PEZI|nr:uncharacterized protein BDZ99DRAFT_176691 [Mytilinidion resinicola]KAF2802878.1 hypothetical protein BDZ99DRAFT_176691 [Mytilinidion resinicola]